MLALLVRQETNPGTPKLLSTLPLARRNHSPISRPSWLAEAVLCWIIADAVILNAHARVCGVPALVLRRLLRRTKHDFWTRRVVARELKISPESEPADFRVARAWLRRTGAN